MLDAPVNRKRLIATFLDFLHINSTSRREQAMADRVCALLEELGAEVEFDNAAEALGGETGNIIARLPGNVDAPTLLFCAHIDTVAPTDQLTVKRVDGRFTSDGTTILGADDKAGVAAIVEMLRVLLESGMRRPPLEIVFTVAEEIGIMGSMVLDYSRLTARYGFVPDASGDVGLIITRAPAQKHLHITIFGKCAHAGMAPETGISAITVAAKAIARMTQGRVDEETTANIGIIRGGKATNIIPEMVTLEGEARSRDPQKLDAQVAHMRACFIEEAEAAGATAEVDVSDVYPSFNLSEESRAVQLARQGLAELGIPPIVTATGGGSDANFLNSQGIETVILSTGYHHPHAHDEYQEEDQLVQPAQWLVNITQEAVKTHG